MKYNLKKKYQIALRRAYATDTPSKEIVTLLGATKEKLKEHINKYLLPGMQIDGFGKVWGLDHIVPAELFDLNSEDDKQLCYNFLNIIPMYNNDNRIKGASVHFSLEKLKIILAKENDEKNKEIILKLIDKCNSEITNRYAQYLF